MQSAKHIKRFEIDKPARFRLADCATADTGGLDIEKDEAKRLIAEDIKQLAHLQERLYADGRYALLVVLQGMDAAGKDSVIKHVLSGINPQGCSVHSFKAPSTEELGHDFLWRSAVRLPERGRIGIFNRSYYEDVLVVRVHPELLARGKLPPQRETKNIWNERFEDIRAFERHLTRSGTVLVKFHLRISPDEQRRRFFDRLDDSTKRWKFSVGDIAERKLWDQYMAAYEDMIRNTSTPEAPWYVVPADHKWFAQLVVAGVLVDTLERLKPQFPAADGLTAPEIKKAREKLLAEARDDAGTGRR